MEISSLPPLDTSALGFDVDREIRRTLVDLMRGDAPTTILGLLFANPDGIGVDELVTRLGLPISHVNWGIDRLEEEDLCVRVEVGGSMLAVPLAAYTSRNE